MRVVRDTTDCDHNDPAALIARALRKKFASQKRVERSPGSDSASSPGNQSVCWSPESSTDVVPPTPLVSKHSLYLSLFYYRYSKNKSIFVTSYKTFLVCIARKLCNMFNNMYIYMYNNLASLGKELFSLREVLIPWELLYKMRY